MIAAGLDGVRARADAARAGRRRPGDAAGRRARARPLPGDAGRGARRARRRRRADGALGRRARRRPYLAVRRSEWAAFSAGDDGIHAPAGSLREVLSAIGLVDHHAHGILREPPRTLDEFRGLFSESEDPRQWPHVATAITYRRAIGVLARALRRRRRRARGLRAPAEPGSAGVRGVAAAGHRHRGVADRRRLPAAGRQRQLAGAGASGRLRARSRCCGSRRARPRRGRDARGRTGSWR